MLKTISCYNTGIQEHPLIQISGDFGEVGIDQHETPPEAAVRELQEELSITVLPSELIHFKVYRERNFNGQDVWEAHIFILQDNGDHAFVLGGEGDGLQYFSKDEIIKMSDTDPPVQKVIPDYFASLS